MRVYGGDDGSDDDPDEIAVGLADYATASDGQRLTSSGIGSCVVVALFDDEATVGGLVHFMLPASAEIADDDPAKFADTGIETLMASMETEGGDRRRMEAKLVGGANMLDITDKNRLIGTRNVRAAKEELDAAGVPVVAEETGGSHGRSLVFDSTDGSLRIRGPHAETRSI